MNEMLVTGYFYLKTDATTNEEALADFQKACKEVGIDPDVTSIVVRDKDGEDLTERIENPFY